MSSAILYLAIVAIWAVVLVPRWLRPRPAEPQPAEPQLTGQSEELSAAEPSAAEAVAPGPTAASRPADAEPGDTPAWAQADDPGPAAEPVLGYPASRQADTLRARRRMLGMIVTLTAAAVGLAVARIAAPWVIIPPAVLLFGFLLLLREAARSDTERARRATLVRHAATPPLAGEEPGSSRDGGAATPGQVAVTVSAPDIEAAPDAEVIDISARVVDQVYDQYADAANRAVGD